ncbi:c2 domain-containing protein [Ditylenchus destructor]|uniref:C2 domain-containing protein n=1 Tax=Ditylenchus destructor TaxID=166010 RepID=A0AAD4NDB0_9BILA|nr:c2 domain-containing protein [Ditylenchus destructor]
MPTKLADSNFDRSDNANYEHMFQKLQRFIFGDLDSESDSKLSPSNTLALTPQMCLLLTILALLLTIMTIILLCRLCFRRRSYRNPSLTVPSTNRCWALKRLWSWLHWFCWCQCCYCCCCRKSSYYTSKRRPITILSGFSKKGEAGDVSYGMRAPQLDPTLSWGGTNRFRNLQRKIVELPAKHGKLPQIRISISSCNTSPERANSMMSNLSSAGASPWNTEKRFSFNAPTPQSPGSPSSLSSTFKEPLLRTSSASSEKQHKSNVIGFWHRLSNGSHRSSTASNCSSQHDNCYFSSGHQAFLAHSGNGNLSPNHLLPFGMVDKYGDGQGDDDREIDNRSVLHYELGFYGKTLTSCFRGSLTFQLRYDFIHRVLMLHVMRSNHLPLQDDPPDPYIKMYCLPERRHPCKTRIFKKSCDPEFNEIFAFDVPYAQLANRMLQFTVYDFDRFTRHDLIGNVIMRDLFEKSDLYHWTEYTMQIVGSQEKNDYGDLLLYLAYSPVYKKLYVTVSKAYNLRPMDITGASDPYVKVEQIYQRKRVKLRKTSIKRANLNPVYHECLEFDLAPEQVNETHLLVQVMDWDRIGRDDLLGCCVLGKESPTKEGRLQWEQTFTPPQPNQQSSLLNISGHEQEEEKGNTSISHKKSVVLAASIAPSPLAVTDGKKIAMSGNGLTGIHQGKSVNGTAGSVMNGAMQYGGDGGENKFLKPVGTWHSILGEVPEGFRNIPKAKKKS